MADTAIGQGRRKEGRTEIPLKYFNECGSHVSSGGVLLWSPLGRNWEMHILKFSYIYRGQHFYRVIIIIITDAAAAVQ